MPRNWDMASWARGMTSSWMFTGPFAIMSNYITMLSSILFCTAQSLIRLWRTRYRFSINITIRFYIFPMKPEKILQIFMTLYEKNAWIFITTSDIRFTYLTASTFIGVWFHPEEKHIDPQCTYILYSISHSFILIAEWPNPRTKFVRSIVIIVLLAFMSLSADCTIDWSQ